jgi:hypothetical protein
MACKRLFDRLPPGNALEGLPVRAPFKKNEGSSVVQVMVRDLTEPALGFCSGDNFRLKGMNGDSLGYHYTTVDASFFKALPSKFCTA